MRHPPLSRHYSESGVVAPRAWEASLSCACPKFHVIQTRLDKPCAAGQCLAASKCPYTCTVGSFLSDSPPHQRSCEADVAFIGNCFRAAGFQSLGCTVDMQGYILETADSLYWAGKAPRGGGGALKHGTTAGGLSALCTFRPLVVSLSPHLFQWHKQNSISKIWLSRHECLEVCHTMQSCSMLACALMVLEKYFRISCQATAPFTICHGCTNHLSLAQSFLVIIGQSQRRHSISSG